MTERVRLGARIDSDVRIRVVEHCAARGLNMGRFVQQALLDRMEQDLAAEAAAPPPAEPSRPLDVATEELDRHER